MCLDYTGYMFGLHRLYVWIRQVIYLDYTSYMVGLDRLIELDR